MIPLHDKRSIEMWFKSEIPGEDIRFIRKRGGGFVVHCQNDQIDKRKVKCIVASFYRCAYGSSVKWG